MNRMRIAPAIRKAAVLAAAFVIVGLPGAAPRAEADSSVDLTMSNFHYCAAQSCSPFDQGYVRQDNGPVAGTDNPHGIVDVPAGATVRWVYKDVGPGSCDFFSECPGHNVRIEDGTAEGTRVGGVKARSGELAIVTTITAKPGTLIRYFCSVNKHWQLGMTGILRVVG
jgi:plastocyanin